MGAGASGGGGVDGGAAAAAAAIEHDAGLAQTLQAVSLLALGVNHCSHIGSCCC